MLKFTTVRIILIILWAIFGVQASKACGCDYIYYTITADTTLWNFGTIRLDSGSLDVFAEFEGDCFIFGDEESVSWFRNDVPVDSSSVLGEWIFTGLNITEPGVYKVSIKGEGPESAYMEFVVTGPEYTSEPAAEDFDVYPNPATSFINVDITLYKDSKIEYSISDLSGKVVYSASGSYAEGFISKRLDLYTLSSGYYFLAVSINSRKRIQRIIIQ